MKIALHVFAFLLLSLICAGQNTIVMTPPKDPDVKPEQKTAAIVHYEKMRGTARDVVHELALELGNTKGGNRDRLNEAINYQQDIVDWANWCILALRDKTPQAKACVYKTDLR